jgi:sugar-specific transcriptional regulator TrmB
MVAALMIDDPLLLQLKGIGMSEYEAKVYLIVSALRVADAREIHGQTKIPRGRIYETLTSLAQKGFVVMSGKSPVRYTPVDLTSTFERLKRESMVSLEGLYERLRALESEAPEQPVMMYSLQTEWTRDTQVRMVLRRAKSEVILLCNDKAYLSRFGKEIAQASKRVALYLVAGEEDHAAPVMGKSYLGGNDLKAALFHPDTTANYGISMKLLLVADRHESLSVMEENGRLTGIFICPDIYACYLSRKIIQEIEPVKISSRIS